MFGGMRGLLMGGLFAAALGGIFGFGALASFLGFALQAALIGGLIFLAYNFFRNRGAMKPAMATARPAAGSSPQANSYRNAASAIGGGVAAAPVIGPALSAVTRINPTISRMARRG